MSLVAASLLGIGLGLRHALEADHIAAVCTLVARHGSVAAAARSGALWGIGHGGVIVVAGGVLVALGVCVPGPIAVALELIVAAMLVGLGVASFWALRAAPSARSADARPSASARKPLAIGFVHGASGTAALTLLVATTFQARTQAIAFVTLFGIASAIGMTAAAALIAWPLRSVVRRSPRVAPGLQRVAGLASVIAGVALALTAVRGS